LAYFLSFSDIFFPLYINLYEITAVCKPGLLRCDFTVAERLRDTLVHELCHAMVWIEDKVIDGHGKYWKYWYCSTAVIAFAVLFNQTVFFSALVHITRASHMNCFKGHFPGEPVVQFENTFLCFFFKIHKT